MIKLTVNFTLWAGLALAQAVPITPKPIKTEKITKTEQLAAEGLGARQQQLSSDMQTYSKDVCDAHKIPQEQCQIDPQKGEVYMMPKPKPVEETPAPKEEKK